MPETVEAAAVETPVSGTSAGESSAVESTIDTGQSTEVETGAEGEKQATDQKLSTTGKVDVRAILKDPAQREALKAINPALVGILRDLEFGKQQLTKEFPGGLKEAVELRNAVQEFGGPQGVREIHEAVQNYDHLDELYTKGDPGFVKQIAEGDPEAFARMVPTAIEEFSRLNPEMYQHIMARVVANTIDQNKFPDALQSLYGMVGDNAQAKAIIEKLWDSIEGFRTVASKVPEKKIDPERQKFEQEKTQFAQQKVKELVQSVDRDSLAHRQSLIEREWKPFGDFSKLDDDRKQAIVNETHARIKKLVMADTGFIAHRQRLIDSGDRNAVAKLERDKLSELVPQIVPRVAKLFGTGAAKPVAKTEQTRTAQTVKPAQGVVMVKSQPSPNQIDRRRTTSEMIFRNTAVLTDGRRVQWS